MLISIQIIVNRLVMLDIFLISTKLIYVIQNSAKREIDSGAIGRGHSIISAASNTKPPCQMVNRAIGGIYPLAQAKRVLPKAAFLYPFKSTGK
jgi:hypothetical protein